VNHERKTSGEVGKDRKGKGKEKERKGKKMSKKGKRGRK
jgi:hypothetical protein